MPSLYDTYPDPLPPVPLLSLHPVTTKKIKKSKGHDVKIQMKLTILQQIIPIRWEFPEAIIIKESFKA